jgi:hypothetical protein
MKAITYTRLCEQLGFRLTRGQLVHDLVAYDGLEPGDLPAEQRELARRIFGAVDTIPASARSVSVQVKGRDVGGTRRGATRLLHLALTLRLDRVGRGELAYCFFGGPKLRHARIGLRFALDAARKAGIATENETADGFTLIRADKRRVRLECFAASRGGDNTRGVSIVAAHLIEAAFYLDEQTGVVNDEAIFAAIVPRLLPGGQIIIESSPWSAEFGLLASEFQKNHGCPTTALAGFCPTLLMRDDPETAATVARERLRDPENARREFDAEFVTDAALAWPNYANAFGEHPGLYLWGENNFVADPGALADDFILLGFRWGEPSKQRVPIMVDTPTWKEAYPARDAEGNQLFHPVPERPLLRIFSIDRWNKADVARLGMRGVTKEIAATMKADGARGPLLTDQASAAYLAALLSEEGIALRSFHLNATIKHEAATLGKTLFRDDQISIVDDSPHSAMARQQLATYRRHAMPGGTYRYTGGSKAAVDDFPAALLTLFVAMLEERGTPTTDTHFNIDGAPTKRAIGGRITVPGRG